MADNNFNELLIHTLKQIHIRLDRLEAKVDEKSDKEDVKVLTQRLDNVGSRLVRLESEVGTFKWMLGIGLTALGVLIAVLKMF